MGYLKKFQFWFWLFLFFPIAIIYAIRFELTYSKYEAPAKSNELSLNKRITIKGTGIIEYISVTMYNDCISFQKTYPRDFRLRKLYRRRKGKKMTIYYDIIREITIKKTGLFAGSIHFQILDVQNQSWFEKKFNKGPYYFKFRTGQQYATWVSIKNLIESQKENKIVI